MGVKVQYRTRQREEILTYLKTVPGKHVTAADVRNHFQAQSVSVGQTTIYRQLEKLVGEGLLKKYFIDEHSSACFEYVDPESHGSGACYHCKCEKCGRLIHMDCHEITELQQHLAEHHHFLIDPLRTVFYGVCESCLKEARREV